MLIVRKLTIAAILLPLLVSCEKKSSDNLRREILVTTMWLEERANEAGGSEYRIHDFSGGGIVKTYILKDGEAAPYSENRYIFYPADDLLAIETVGPLKVIDIEPGRLSLRPEKSGAGDIILHRYDSEVVITE